jgi:LuxR family maltose regulon positive regulatory protein
MSAAESHGSRAQPKPRKRWDPEPNVIGPLLVSKLYIPPPRPNLVARPRLLRRLQEGLQQRHRLTLVSAPAGSGKTTLVTEWVCQVPREVAWVSLDEEDGDPVRFLTYLIAALQQVDGRIGHTVQQILQGPQVPPIRSLVTPLVADIVGADTALILVLDDYQLILSELVHQVMHALLEQQPPDMHIVLNTRQDPPLALHRLRARGELTEIGERDLRFTADEAAEFLTQTMGLDLSAEAVQALEARTEGWISGLQLAALAMKEDLGASRVDAFVSTLPVDDRYVTDYLVAEVLSRQPDRVRTFLIQTSILDRLTGPLCDALCLESAEASGTEQRDSAAILRQLERQNLFLIPLDHRREWYRYHRLFAEVLSAQLAPEERKVLRRRAAHWYESQGHTDQAIHHALASGSESGDWEDALRLIRLAVDETIHACGVLTVRRWLERLPDEKVRGDGELAVYRAWSLILTGDVALADGYIQAAEGRLGGVPNANRARAVLLVLRSFAAVFVRKEYDAAVELANRALRTLTEDQAQWRVIALWALGESQERTRDITEAITTFQQAQRIGRALGPQTFAAMIDLFLATDLGLHGQRREAVDVCQEALTWYSDRLGRSSPIRGLLLTRLGTLYYESNELELARQCLEEGQALAEVLALEGSVPFSYGAAAPTLHAQGDTAAALAALQKAHLLAVQSGLVEAGQYLAVEANIRMAQGDVASAVRWAAAEGLSLDDEPEYLRLDSQVVYSRLLIVQGRLSDARRWLARLERFAQGRGLRRWLITIYLLQALAMERTGDRRAALERLSRALEIAAPEGYFRAFLDEGAIILELAKEVRAVAPRFVDGLLSFVPDSEGPRETAGQPLVEPLSERELEVLRLIAAGLSNREIATELVIAVGTVKRHINNIYGKLAARSRTQAVAIARDLGLL